jgi:hypothetical protein
MMTRVAQAWEWILAMLASILFVAIVVVATAQPSCR